MKTTALCAFLSALLFGAALLAAAAGPSAQTGALKGVFTAPLAEGQAAFVYLGYSAVIVRTAKGAAVIDPAGLILKEDLDAFKGQKVDVILFTHGHGDHFVLQNAVDLAKATGAVIGAEAGVLASLKKSGAIAADKLVDVASLRPFSAGPWTITPVRGSHIGPIVLYGLGDGAVKIFHGGDSAYVPLAIGPAGLAFLPAGAPSPTASPESALKMALDLKPRTVAAMHGSDAQYKDLGNKLKAALPAAEYIVPQTLKVYTVNAR